jgi:hypothetical protein
LVEGKKERRYEAEEAARKLYDEFAENKSAVTQPTAPQPSPAQTPQEKPAISKKATAANIPLVEYLSNFWTLNSEYAQFKRDVQKHPLTPYYIQMNHDDVRRHVQPFPGFDGVTVGSLNKATLKKWLDMACRKENHTPQKRRHNP